MKALETTEHGREHALEWRGVVADIHEDEAFPFGERGGVQRIVAFIEAVDVLHVRSADEAAVGRVGPGVIGALDRLGELARSDVADLRSAVPADVEERS